MKWVLVLALTGCATTNRVCPLGARPVTEGSPIKRAEYCTSTASTLAHLPSPGRTYEGALGAAMPARLGGGVEGPFTSWHPNGKLASRGAYVDRGSHAEPDGMWGFWWPSGKRWALGRFREGEPVGCFAYWDEAGTRSTGTVTAGVLHEAPCVPPSDEALAAMEGTLAAGPPKGAWADLAIAVGAGAGAFGARSAGQFYPDPSLRGSIEVTARKAIGPVRIGATAGYRLAGANELHGVPFGLAVGVPLPLPYRRLGLELGVDLGAQSFSLIANRARQSGTTALDFWAPWAAAELAGSLQLSDTLDLRLALRADGAPMRDVARDVAYCTLNGCEAPVHETWQVGGFTYGATLGFRWVMR